MLITIVLRLCALIGVCRVQDVRETRVPRLTDLNSFSSKTAYRNSRLRPLKESSDYLSGCKAIQMNVVLRHGARFPSRKDMDRVEAALGKIRASRAFSVMAPVELQRWRMPFTRAKEKELASVGYEEMMLLGHRYRRRLEEMMVRVEGAGVGGGRYDWLRRVRLCSSSTMRARMSAATFLTMFFNDTKSPKEVWKHITENDQYLRFFDNCPHYTNSVLKNKASKMEYNRYANGPEIKKLIKDIQQKWKLTDINLTPDDMRVIYIMCGYEIATNLSSFMRPHECPVSPAGDGLVVCPLHHKFAPIESSPLCSFFDSYQFMVLEYLYDLKHYWTKSYGKEINWLQGCALMSPILQEIMNAARSHQSALQTAAKTKTPLQQHLDRLNYHRATFWFGHAETLLPIITLLGLFNQSHPMDSNSFNKRRSLIEDFDQRFSTFRTSNIIPFSGNLEMELLYCPNLAQADLSGYRVQVKVNEKPVAWPIANGHSHVSLELLMKHLKLCLADKYDHDAICVRGLSASELHQVQKRSDEL